MIGVKPPSSTALTSPPSLTRCSASDTARGSPPLAASRCIGVAPCAPRARSSVSRCEPPSALRTAVTRHATTSARNCSLPVDADDCRIVESRSVATSVGLAGRPRPLERLSSTGDVRCRRRRRRRRRRRAASAACRCCRVHAATRDRRRRRRPPPRRRAARAVPRRRPPAVASSVLRSSVWRGAPASSSTASSS
jgi:hypothetical protein